METEILKEILKRIKQIEKQVAELHAVQTGSLYTAPHKLTRYQQKKWEAQKNLNTFKNYGNVLTEKF